MTTERAFASRLLNKLVIINLQGLILELIVLDTRDNKDTTSKVDLLVKQVDGVGTTWVDINKVIAYEN